MKMRRLLLTIVLLLFTVLGFYLTNKESGIDYSSGNKVGNTAGNLSNKGLFCEQDNLIYFSNLNDNGSLYSMDQRGEDFKKLTSDRVAYINTDEHYLYYSRRNNEIDKNNFDQFEFNSTGLYRVKPDGSKFVSIYSKPIETMNVYQNYIYYLRLVEGSGLELYKTKIDKTEEKRISNEQISPSSIINGIMYYSGIKEDHGIHALDLSSGFSSLLYDGNTYQTIANEQYIYFMSQSDNYSIQRMRLDGANLETIVPERCYTYNLSLSGKYLYYQVDDTINNGIYRINLDTKESLRIISGNFNHINITSNYVFFQKYDSNIVYQLSIGDNNNLEIFNPPVLD